jgi:hypothetical protein
MEACGQHVHEKAADELVCLERHALVALATFEPAVLPCEGDAFLVALSALFSRRSLRPI